MRWCGVGSLMVIIIVALTVIPTIYLAMQEGIAAVDGNLCEMARVYRLSRRKRLMGSYLPAVSAPLLSASVVALGGGMRVPSWGKPSERHMGSASPPRRHRLSSFHLPWAPIRQPRVFHVQNHPVVA